MFWSHVAVCVSVDETFEPQMVGPVRCKENLGGIVKSYYREACMEGIAKCEWPLLARGFIGCSERSTPGHSRFLRICVRAATVFADLTPEEKMGSETARGGIHKHIDTDHDQSVPIAIEAISQLPRMVRNLIGGSGWERAAFKYDENGLCIRDENPFVYSTGVNLFNLNDDPGETRNLADDYADVVEELTTLYKDRRSQMA